MTMRLPMFSGTAGISVRAQEPGYMLGKPDGIRDAIAERVDRIRDELPPDMHLEYDRFDRSKGEAYRSGPEDRVEISAPSREGGRFSMRIFPHMMMDTPGQLLDQAIDLGGTVG